MHECKAFIERPCKAVYRLLWPCRASIQSLFSASPVNNDLSLEICLNDFRVFENVWGFLRALVNSKRFPMSDSERFHGATLFHMGAEGSGRTRLAEATGTAPGT